MVYARVMLERFRTDKLPATETTGERDRDCSFDFTCSSRRRDLRSWVVIQLDVRAELGGCHKCLRTP